MATHKSRSGQLIVCYPCKQGACDICVETQLEDSNIVCHCTNCREWCGEHACEVVKVRNKKIAGKKVCERCWTTSCDCDR